MTDETRAKQEIGRTIKQLRIAKELTIKDLAQKASMSTGYLSEVERGGSSLSGEKLAALARCLGTSVDYLLTGTGEPSQPLAETRIPAGLAQAAESLNLSYVQTVRLLAGKTSLVAARRQEQDDWTAGDWIQFYEKVKRYI